MKHLRTRPRRAHATTLVEAAGSRRPESLPTIAASPLWFAHARPADGCIEGDSTIVRILTSIFAFAILVTGVLIVLAGPDGADADEVLKLPGYGRWRVLSGYNTATHTGTDPYALDLVRDDATTAGTQVLAPVSGRIRFSGSSSGCIGIDDGRGATIHLCHTFAAVGLDRGDTVQVGQVIGTVAPDGAANNNGIAHVHMAVHVDGSTVPFTGIYALEGHQLPATTAPNAYYGNVFASSQDTSVGGSSGGNSGGGTTAQPIEIDAGDDFEVDQGATVTLTAVVGSESEILEFDWTQTFGPPVDFSDSGRSISFIAPHEPGATLLFTVEAHGAFNRVGSDSIVVAVTNETAAPAPSAPTPSNTPTPTTEAQIVTGSVPNQGFGLFVFSGGTSADLVWASGCPVQTARFWATSGGQFVVYIPGTQVAAANAAWFATFPAGLPANTPLLGRCL